MALQRGQEQMHRDQEQMSEQLIRLTQALEGMAIQQRNGRHDYSPPRNPNQDGDMEEEDEQPRPRRHQQNLGSSIKMKIPAFKGTSSSEEVGDPPLKLPFSHSDEFIEPFVQPSLRERMFHFSPESVAKLKARANEECRRSTTIAEVVLTISSFQVLSALVWMSITRVRGLPADETTSCGMANQDRGRLRPLLPPDYFGNAIYAISDTTIAGKLVAGGLGAAGLMLNQAIAGHDDDLIRGLLRAWHAAPRVYGQSMFDKKCVMMGSSPRFDMYGCEFRWGKAVALRSGSANKFDGKVSSYPGREGRGSVDLEVCLLPEYMSALLSDKEFMDVVSTPPASV